MYSIVANDTVDTRLIFSVGTQLVANKYITDKFICLRIVLNF